MLQPVGYQHATRMMTQRFGLHLAHTYYL